MQFNARVAATKIIARWLEQGVYPGLLLENVETDRAFTTELVYGVVRQYSQLKWIINRCAAHKLSGLVFSGLLIAVYQILYLSNVPEYAAVNEAVKYVKSHTPGAAGLTNAVLRRIVRERGIIEADLKKQSLAVQLSHPQLLLDRWEKHFSADLAVQIANWNNERAGLTITANLLKISSAELENKLSEQSILLDKINVAGKTFFYLKRGVAVSEVTGFADGLFLATDPAAANAVELLGAQAGMRVLDACAAPGGKTALIAGAMRQKGVLTAWELQPKRLERLKDNLTRLGLDAWVCSEVVDALQPPENLSLFDCILLDVPCSNTGVIRHKPDVRWRFSLTRLKELNQLQFSLLNSAAKLLAAGGRLVYSTCSLEPEENGILVRSWLAEQNIYQLLAERQGTPPLSGTDGFYAAVIMRQF